MGQRDVDQGVSIVVFCAYVIINHPVRFVFVLTAPHERSFSWN